MDDGGHLIFLHCLAYLYVISFVALEGDQMSFLHKDSPNSEVWGICVYLKNLGVVG